MVLLGALSAFAGCNAHTHYPFQGSPVAPPQAPARESGFSDYSFRPADLTLQDGGKNGYGYNLWRLSMPASYDNGQPGNLVTGTYYAGVRPGRHPLVIVLPVWGVSDYPSARMAETIVRRSRGAVNVLLVDGERRLVAWPDIAASTSAGAFAAQLDDAASRLRHAILDIRRVMDWADRRPELDGRRIGLVGFSVGAVVGSLVAQNDRRVRSAALVMGGADIPAIMGRCPRSKGRTREAVRERLGLSRRRYERAIAGAFSGLDPLDYPGRVDPSGMLIVDAAYDECIPPGSREALWEVLGRPERITMHYGHRGAFLAMTPLGLNFLRDRLYAHLEDTL
jgi:hypothetical protein